MCQTICLLTDILHKSDAKGVKLNLESDDEIKAAYQEIIKNAKAYKHDADIHGVLVSPMSSSELEVIVGTKTDDQFGPVIMYGLRGDNGGNYERCYLLGSPYISEIGKEDAG